MQIITDNHIKRILSYVQILKKSKPLIVIRSGVGKKKRRSRIHNYNMNNNNVFRDACNQIKSYYY